MMRRILVIERDPDERVDHLLAFWTEGGTQLDPLIERRWTTLRVVTADGEVRECEAMCPQYVATRRARVTARTRRPNLHWLTGEVQEIVDGAEEGAVRVGDRWYRGAWVFDARRAAPGPATVCLLQHFTGWVVESTALRLDPEVATLFDFRTAQVGGVGFMYVLPLAPGRALVEHVFTGPVRRAPAIYTALMRRPAGMLRFLDERPRLGDLLGLLLALPKWVFVRATWRWLWARRVADPHDMRSRAAAPGVSSK